MSPKDYKSPARTAPTRSGSPMLVGIAIGLVAGLAIALAVAIYLFKFPPFTQGDAAKAGDAATPAKTATEPKQPVALAPEAAGGGEAKPLADKPKYEFFDILPGKGKVARENSNDAAVEKTGQERALVVYYLQAGAFRNADDADNLKARLALAGIETQIQSAELPDRGVWHRVRVGPFQSIEELDPVKARLKENRVEATVLKIQEKRAP